MEEILEGMNRSEIPLLLASASPRRLDLLRAAGFKPQVRIPEVDESPRLNETAVGLVERLAITKAKSIGEKEWLTVAGDTVVEIRGEILGKPESPEEAVRMLMTAMKSLMSPFSSHQDCTCGWF